MELSEPPLVRIQWRPCWRIIPSRYPPIGLFERVASPEDLDAVIEIESMTNPRMRQEAGELHLVPEEDRVTGPGAGYIMAAFTHLNPQGSRFSDGTWGVWYAGADLDTAIAETRHHREAFLRATSEPPMALDMRVLVADLDAEMHDIRGWRDARPDIYDPRDYAASQAFARSLRQSGSWGIVYMSLRHPQGECAAVFRPPALANCRQERHLRYIWDGTAITDIQEIRPMR